MLILPKQLELSRFFVRHLCDDDVNERYLYWLRDTAAKEYIEYAKEKRQIEELITYVQEKNDSETAIFMGIFTLQNNIHIGNIKYEPIDLDNNIAEMGILVGDNNWRGKGVAPEVIKGTGNWLSKNLGIETITLGVSKENTNALRAYEKIGFKVAEIITTEQNKSAFRMEISTENL